MGHRTMSYVNRRGRRIRVRCVLLVNTRNESAGRHPGALLFTIPWRSGASTRSSAFKRRLKTASTACPNVADINFPACAWETLTIDSSFLIVPLAACCWMAFRNFIKVVPRFLSLHVAASTSFVTIQSVGRITPRGRKIWLNRGWSSGFSCA